MNKQVKVLIDKDGNVRVDAVGYQGPSCLLATGPLVSALGGLRKEELKPEYFEQAQTQTGMVTN